MIFRPKSAMIWIISKVFSRTPVFNQKSSDLCNKHVDCWIMWLRNHHYCQLRQNIFYQNNYVFLAWTGPGTVTLLVWRSLHICGRYTCKQSSMVCFHEKKMQNILMENRYIYMLERSSWESKGIKIVSKSFILTLVWI